MPRGPANSSHKVQITVETYTHHVLEQLVGIKGRDRSDVAVFILRSWIADHQEELREYGIKATVKDGEIEFGGE